MAPMPLIECATGICSFSASASSSSAAPPYFTPWPTRITGCSAASSMSTAFLTPSGSAPQRDEMLALHSSGFGVSSAAASMNTSNGTSSTTGPGRPVTMVFHACRTIIGTCSPRVGWYTFLHTPRTVEGKSACVLAVQLLERAAAELRGRHVAGDGEERHRIEIGGGERDRQVHRAGPARGEGRDRLALHAVVGVGHEAADALVMHRDGLDVVLALMQRVDELDVAVAAQAEGVGHLLADQVVDDDLAAVQSVVGGAFEHLFHQFHCAVVIGQVEILRRVRRRPALDLLAELEHVVEALGAELRIRVEAEARLDHQVVAALGQ